jgi:hypothetical protein
MDGESGMDAPSAAAGDKRAARSYVVSVIFLILR